MIIYHKSNCSTSLEALRLLKQAGVQPLIKEYIVDPPTQKELRELLKMLGCKAIDIVRKKEPLYKEQFADKKMSNAEWIRVLSKNPVLIERPIVIEGNKALIGRPPETVLNLVSAKK